MIRRQCSRLQQPKRCFVCSMIPGVPWVELKEIRHTFLNIFSLFDDKIRNRRIIKYVKGGERIIYINNYFDF